MTTTQTNRAPSSDERDFDLDRYLRASKRVDLSSVEWDRIPKFPLSDEEIFCLHYMMDIETHTVVYLRDLLATRAVNDPYVTAFLSCWVYEELWHGEAFSEFLRRYGIEQPTEPKIGRVTPLPTRPNRTATLREALGVGHKFGWLLTMLGSALTKDFVAVHMTWGAVNELTTLTAYHQTIRKTQHPILVQMLNQVIKDERRHFAFYRAQARMRLERSARARRLTKWVMEHLWTPVGIGVKTFDELDVLVGYLFGDEAGRTACADMDERISALPGLGDLRLLSHTAEESQKRLAGKRTK